MRKFILLGVLVAIGFSSKAQIDTLINENFEGTPRIPADWVYPPSWRDTTSLFVSSNHSLLNSGKQTPRFQDTLEFPVFSTQNGKRFVFFSYYQIAKLYFLNFASIQTSIDSGVTWQPVLTSEYRGPAPGFAPTTSPPEPTRFNPVIYTFDNDIWQFQSNSNPTNSWWKKESYDLTNTFEGPTGAGYKNCQIRFFVDYAGKFPATTPGGSTTFGSGWYLDDIQLLRSTCELTPPSMTFTYAQNPATQGGLGCIANKPENGIVRDTSNTYYVAVAARDDTSGIADIVLRWRKKGTTVWTVDSLGTTGHTPFINGIAGWNEYRDTLNNIFVGDTVEYFLRAYDNACPNSSRLPDSIIQPYYSFYPEPGYPNKCGNPFCGVLPTIVNTFPWIEDFEAPQFVAGSGPGSTAGNTLHRGIFPSGDVTGKYWTVAPNPTQAGFAWSVRNATPTATNLTGPSSNHTSSGTQYLYTEADQGTFGNFTNVVTPCIDLTNQTGCMAWEFWYHLYGDQINMISVEVDDGMNNAQFTVIDTIMGQQQDSTTQPWKRFVLDLTPYVGTFVRLRLKAFRGTGVRGDMAVDDFKVFKPQSKEFEVLEIKSPLAGSCSYGATEDVTFTYRHAGCDNVTFIPFAYRINNGPIQLDSIYGNFSTGSSGDHTFKQAANLSAFGTYTIKVWTNDPVDGNKNNDTLLSQTIVVSPQFSSFPYVEKFEDGVVGSRNFNFSNPVFKITNGQDNNYGWQVGRELTPTRNTGPWRGYYFEANGKYAYTSSTNPTGGSSTGNVNTFLQTINCLDFTGMTDPQMTFMHHMYGTDIDRLEIEYSTGTNGEDWQLLAGSTIFRSAVAAIFPNEVSDWQVVRVDLGQFAGSSVKIRIKGRRAAGGGLADIAIDNIHIYDRAANDVGISRLQRPNIAISAAGNTVPRVRIENYTNSAITNVPVVIEIIPLCNQGTPQTYRNTITTAVPANGNLDADFDILTSTPPLVYPVGEFKVKVYTDLAGDAFAENDTVIKNLTRLGRYEIPFSDNFDSCAFSSTGFATTGSGFRQWELGRPGAPFLNGFSTPNAWTVNKEGAIVTGTTEVLLLPTFYGFDSIVAGEVFFYHNGSFSNNSAGTIEYSSGAVAGNWAPLVGTDPTLGLNWFGSAVGTNADAKLSSGAKPNGTGGWTSGLDGNGWTPSWYPVDFYNNDSSDLTMRFRFNSTQTAGGPIGGWSIDNFAVIVPPQHSAAPVRIQTVNPLPVPGNAQPVDITVQNTGKQLLRSYTQEVIWDVNQPNELRLTKQVVIVDSNTFVTEGKRYVTRYIDDIPATAATAGLHDVCVITSFPNAKTTDNRPQDDTLCLQIRVLDEFIFDTVGNSEYCNNFDGAASTFDFFGLNNYTYDSDPNSHSWEKGTPIQFPAAFSPPNAWMTDLDSNYKSRDSSSLFTPVFVVQKDTNYEVSFMHYFETERATDGGVFMVSDNGGKDWQTIGFSAEKDWYNTRFVNALDIIKPGWTDTSGGWDSARYVFNFAQGDQVIFKFRFESDWDVEYAGWAIDDFCLKQTAQEAGFVIGQEEFNPIESVFFGELAPNPSREKSALPFNIPENKEMYITVTNMMGQTVEMRSERFERGANAIFFETNRWQSGMYNINVSFEGTTINRKLIVRH